MSMAPSRWPSSVVASTGLQWLLFGADDKCSPLPLSTRIPKNEDVDVAISEEGMSMIIAILSNVYPEFENTSKWGLLFFQRLGLKEGWKLEYLYDRLELISCGSNLFLICASTILVVYA